MSNQSDDPFNYNDIDLDAVKQVYETCFAKTAQGKYNANAMVVIDGVATILRRIVTPIRQRQWSFWVIFGGLTVILALGMLMANWPHVPYPTFMVIIGLLAAISITKVASSMMFRAAVKQVIIEANCKGVLLEWMVTQRPDLQRILDDLSAAGLPIRQVIRRFITHRPNGAVPPDIVAEMQAYLEAHRTEILS